MSSFGEICISLNLQHVNFQKQLKGRLEMPFLFVVNRLGHSMGSFVTLQPIFHFLLLTRTDPYCSSSTGFSCGEDKIKRGIKVFGTSSLMHRAVFI